jgi:serine/threonine protein kinase
MGQLCCKDNHKKSVSLKGSAHLHHNLLREQERDFREVYDVVGLIGEGSISQIYKIRKKESAIGGSSRLSDSSILTHTSETTKPGYTIFALKEIDTTFLKEGCGEVLRNEIELLKDLDHPNIIKVRALGSSCDSPTDFQTSQHFRCSLPFLGLRDVSF